MQTKRHSIGLTSCALLMAVIEYIAIVWSLADFHPGYIPDLPEPIHRQARLGDVMFRLFEWPLQRVTSVVGHSNFNEFVQWILLPLLYGAAVYIAFLIIRRSICSHCNRKCLTMLLR